MSSIPAANLSTSDVNNAAPIRIPKIAVRNRTSNDGASQSTNGATDQRQSHDDRPPLSSHSSERTLAPGFVRRQSDQSYQSQDSFDRLRRRPDSHGSTQSPAKDQTKHKKKNSGVLGFLTLKEPSTSAWEEYAEAQKKAAAQKAGRSTAVGLSGVSSQKLPECVPSTSSKWDGLPQSTKRISTGSKRNSKCLSTFSTSTRQTDRSAVSSVSKGSAETSSKHRFGSISSKPARLESVFLPPSKRASVQSNLPLSTPTAAMKTGPALVTAPSQPILRQYSTVTPWDEPLESEPEPQPPTDPNDGQQTFLHPPSPPPASRERLSLLPTPELELPELRLHYHTTPEHSPRTPLADFDAEHVLAIGNHTDGREALPEQNGIFWHSDADNEAEVTTQLNLTSTQFGKPRAECLEVPNSKPEVPIKPAIAEEIGDEDVMQSSLRDETGRTSPFIFEQPSPRLRQTPALHGRATAILPTRTGSKSSRLMSSTATIATTASAPVRSPAFSTPSISTRPSTTASGTSAATAHRRPSLSPLQSNSDATSIANSEMSAQWTMSLKDRLGLGGKMTRRAQAAALPWELEEGPAVGSVKRQSSTVTSRGLETGKLKGLSLRLGRK